MEEIFAEFLNQKQKHHGKEKNGEQNLLFCRVRHAFYIPTKMQVFKDVFNLSERLLLLSPVYPGFGKSFFGTTLA